MKSSLPTLTLSHLLLQQKVNVFSSSTSSSQRLFMHIEGNTSINMKLKKIKAKHNLRKTTEVYFLYISPGQESSSSNILQGSVQVSKELRSSQTAIGQPQCLRHSFLFTDLMIFHVSSSQEILRFLQVKMPGEWCSNQTVMSQSRYHIYGEEGQDTIVQSPVVPSSFLLLHSPPSCPTPRALGSTSAEIKQVMGLAPFPLPS